MKRPRLTVRQWVGYAGFALVFLLTAAVAVWSGDILQAGLDPQVPFQTYRPPPAPDYANDDAWALRDQRLPASGEATVFFVHSTTFDGGRNWNGPIDDRAAQAYLRRVVLPNYAAPFARAGSISAPLYRQASLYTRLTLRDDARDARAFAYRDIAAAFEVFLQRHPDGPIVLAGVEQGAELLERLLRERIGADPALRRRLAAAYLIDALVDPARLGVAPCSQPTDTRCVVAFSQVDADNDGAAARRVRRALVWTDRGGLENLAPSAVPLCVNPISGRRDEALVEARHHRGATNATGLEWGARPALMAREVSAQCRAGVLRTTQPDLESLKPRGTWSERRKALQYNLFYGDLEHDVQVRLGAWKAANPA